MALTWWVVTSDRQCPIAYSCRTWRTANELLESIRKNGGNGTIELNDAQWEGVMKKADLSTANVVSR